MNINPLESYVKAAPEHFPTAVTRSAEAFVRHTTSEPQLECRKVGPRAGGFRLGDPPPVSEPSEQRVRRQGPALHPLLTEAGRWREHCTHETFWVVAFGPSWSSEGRAGLVTGAPGTAHLLIGQRLARQLSGPCFPPQPTDWHRPSLSPRLSFPPFAVRPGTLPPPLSVACHLHPSLWFPFSLEAWLQRGSQPLCASLPGPRKPGTRSILLQGLPSGSGTRCSGHTQQATNTTNQPLTLPTN